MTSGHVLAIDLGTSAVKAILWSPRDGATARGHASVPTAHPQPGHDEQDAEDWWSAVQTAIGELPLDNLLAVGLSSQRETFVCLDDNAQPVRPAILWSDGRAASPAVRFAWLQKHEPDAVRRTRWLAAPKDYVLQRLVGRLVTDTTLASRTDVDAALLPDIVEPRTVVGEFHGAPVVAGAGDRACEVLAVAASSYSPMVSWGTTANCSFPVDTGVVPQGWRSSRYVDGRALVEAGLSAAGSAMAWLSERVGLPTQKLQTLAAASPAGANGVVCLPWLNGARAPWWRLDADIQVIGASTSTSPGDQARAVYEGVAHDLRRCLAALPQRPHKLSLAGGGATDGVWQQVLMGITNLPITVRDGGDAAAIGAALLAHHATPSRGGRDEVVVTPGQSLQPDSELAAAYVELSKAHDAAAAAVLGSTT